MLQAVCKEIVWLELESWVHRLLEQRPRLNSIGNDLLVDKNPTPMPRPVGEDLQLGNDLRPQDCALEYPWVTYWLLYMGHSVAACSSSVGWLSIWNIVINVCAALISVIWFPKQFNKKFEPAKPFRPTSFFREGCFHSLYFVSFSF